MQGKSEAAVDYQKLQFAYRRVGEVPQRVHPVAVVGAGPIGLAAAIDLAQQGVPVVLLDNDDTLSTGSRAICFAKRTLEIFDRLGCGQRMVDKGVCWNVGKVFLRDEQVYAFDLLPETGHRRPAFINLQQYYVEGYLAERAAEFGNIDIRWKNEVVGIEQRADRVTLDIATPEGRYALDARYVVAADGSRSAMRRALGQESHGRTFKDRFLIADVKMKAPFPAERWFWFDPPFHPNQSVLLHRQPDDVWRIDFQLGWDADPAAEKEPARVIPRIKALLGEDVDFELEWVSVYTFSCLRMDRFRHGRVLFAGDSAHGVSPFGARGANSGIQDADNLAWKLKLVLDGTAPDALLDSYASEREYAADENILNSTRSTDFITPKTPISRIFRDATLKLARTCPFARRLVNSGRLSVPAVLRESVLNTPDSADDAFDSRVVPGAPIPDAPIRMQGSPAWFLDRISGNVFAGLHFCGTGEDARTAAGQLAAFAYPGVALDRLLVLAPGAILDDTALPCGVAAIEDAQGVLARRLDAKAGSFYLLRPDQHLCARWRAWNEAAVAAAIGRAIGRQQQ
ncbi:FAD-dependent oxidoreductase [Bordetella sp. FB-8]|uniref:FAD-dependent oxidoreductase n=1 Tax=Bordetella sp. FB-8 TaxID=1159870 RepID=UPI000372F7B8|nr:FAD-dependent oxidoreductase [Bordetella sp. FB-8]